MQGDLLTGGFDEQDTFKVLEVKEQKFGLAYWPVYIRTIPVKWAGPEQSEKLPWEE